MKISICGVDGSGKTSIIRALQAQYAATPGLLRAFRAPQYHEDADAPFGALSAQIDELSVQADREGDPLLKTCALFLSMTLYGDVEAHYERVFKPRYLFSERQALGDSLAYSKFYKGLLTGPMKPRALTGLATLESWVEVLKTRLPGGSPVDASALNFWNLPVFIRGLFELPPDALIAHLKSLYHCDLPDQIILLRVSSPRLIERLAMKAAGGTQKELHEKQQILEMLQHGLEQSGRLLASMRPGMKMDVLDTSELSLDESKARCLKLAGL